MTSPRALCVCSVAEASSTKPSVALVREPWTSTSRVNVAVGLGVSSDVRHGEPIEGRQRGQLVDELRVGVRRCSTERSAKPVRIAVDDADGGSKSAPSFAPAPPMLIGTAPWANVR